MASKSLSSHRWRSAALLWCIGVFVFGWDTHCLGQADPPPSADATATTESNAGAGESQDDRRIQLPAKITLQDLVELAVREAERSVEFRADELRGEVSLRLQRPVSASELWALTASALEAQGLVLVPTGVEGVLRIVPVARASASGPSLQRAVDSPEAFTTVLIDLEQLTAEEAIAAVRPALTPSHSASAALGPNRILLTDTGSRLAAAQRLITLAEDAADPMERRIHPLGHQPAQRVVEAVERLTDASRSGVGGGATSGAGLTARGQSRDSVFRLEPLPDGQRLALFAPRSRMLELVELVELVDVPEAGAVRSFAVPGMEADALAEALRTRAAILVPGVETEGDDARLAIRPEPTTGAVFVRAAPSILDGLDEFVEEVVRTRPDLREELRFFLVRHRDAEELRGVLEGIIQEGAGFAGEAQEGAAVTEQPAPITGTFRGDSGRLRLSVDVATNTLIASGPTPQLRRLVTLLQTLDTQQPQVMIEVTLVTINESRSLDLGVELETQFRNGRTTTNLATAFGLGMSDIFAPGTGLTGLVLRPGDFEVLVRAVEATNSGRSMSMPKVLVTNNSPASLRSVTQEPFTSINASSTVATTSFGGTEDAGTTVTVTPQIAPGDHLTLEYAIELSSFTGSSTTTEGGGVIPPPTQVNSLEGTATVPDSFTVIAGGLRLRSDGKTRTQVPLIGSIPIFGLLFGSQGEDDSETRFYVFIRGTILRGQNFETLRLLSDRERGGAGLAHDGPVNTPLWMD